MAKASSVLLLALDEGKWRVVILGKKDVARHEVTPSAPDPDTTADAVAKDLSTLPEVSAWLAIPADWCMCARVDTQNLEGSQTREALRYRLETKLPLSAEEMVADTLEITPTQSLGVAAPKAKIEPLLRALESRGIYIEGISTASFLAAQALLQGKPKIDAVLYSSHDHFELFTIHGERPDSWSVLARDTNDLTLRLSVIRPDHEGLMRLALIGDEVRLPSSEIERVLVEQTSQEEAAIAMGGEILAGRAQPWIDIGRDLPRANAWSRRHRVAIITAGCSLLFLFVAVIVALNIRAARYEAVARECGKRVAESAQETLGKRPPSDDVASVKRMLSRHERQQRRVKGVTQELPQETSALMLLYEALSRLPGHIRHRITEIRVSSKDVLIEGQCLTFSDVDSIASSLRASGTFDIDPPRITQLPEKGVTFALKLVPRAGEGGPP